MGVGRWRGMLVPMVVLIAGCLPTAATPDLPTSLLDEFGSQGQTFSVQAPPTGEAGQAVVAAMQRADPAQPMFRGRAVPVFGVIDCHGNLDCVILGPNDQPRGAYPVWVVLYPDCVDNTGDIGWAVVTGLRNGEVIGYSGHRPCGS